MIRQVWSTACLVALGTLASPAQIPVPASGCYHAAFTPNYPAGGSYGHQNFDSLAGKPIAIEMFYTGWPANHSPDFPVSTCNTIVSLGCVPHLTWEPWVSGSPYPLDGIINGSYDTYIIGYAVQVKNWGKPLFIRVGHEMNGNWYPWCGSNNGGSTLTGFGDPGKADGPERFVTAFRRVRHLFDSVGVSNVAWIWCANNFSTPYEAWNQPEQFYPGDDVVDWIGLDGYNWGSSQSWSNWSSFYDTFNEIYNRFKTSPKPLMIAEFASTELGGSKSQWIRDVFLYTKVVFPRIKALTWFNINKETDWRINSSDAAVTAYRQSLADAYYLSSVPSSAVSERENRAAGIRFDVPTPNPANGAVRLSFTLPSAMECRVVIHNVLGQEVRRLGQDGYGPGTHTIAWDTRDEQGTDVPSGFYIVALQTGLSVSPQKLIIIR
jgi:hypothetical protein